MKQTPLKIKYVLDKVSKFGITLTKKDSAIKFSDKNITMIMINKEPAFFHYGEEVVPTLKYLLKAMILPTVTVDMGAVKFVVNGADIMRPGIVDIGTFDSGEFIVIIDVNNKMPLAVGIANMDSSEMESVSSGKVVKNIHYVGDEIWKFA